MSDPNPLSHVQTTRSRRPVPIPLLHPFTLRPGPESVQATVAIHARPIQLRTNLQNRTSTLDPARWDRINELFHAALGREPGERAAFLREASAGDASLYDEVHALLAAESAAQSALGGMVGDAMTSLLGAALVGARVGPYRIVRELGHGGMGAVYLADRVDGQFDQQVALKLVKHGMDTEQFLQRFRAERQILARLQHPNIARLLDGGIDANGRPYFALEYVVGEPIDRYCDARGLAIDDRLALFLAACHAVMYAHGNLVVHRDLKPAHILVTEDGQVRLLDFGIAKVLSEDDAQAGLTQVGIRAFTPAYASPEHVRGEAVGTSTDVYSLGMILYELLTGVRPYEVENRSPLEVERVVCHTEPEKPSTKIAHSWGASVQAAETFGRAHGLDPARARRRLTGDLDVICLKALQKEPARRYPSAEALLEDIRRNLAGLPVLARPDTIGYRVAKFVGRHRLGLAGTAASVALFAALVGFYTVRLSNERDRAQQEAAKAEQVATFLTGLFEVSDPSESSGQTITARELLDQGAQRIERELASQPIVRASMMRVIGDVYHSLGLHTSAKPLLERALQEHRRLYGATHEETAESETALAVLLQDMGDVKAAEPLYRHALATRQQVFGAQHEKVSESLGLLAFLLETNGDYANAEQLARQVLELDRRLFAADHPRIAESKAKLAGMLRRQQRHDDAEPLLREALAAQRKHYGNKDLNVASTIRNLASLLRDRGALAEAESLYQEALAIRREILGDVHPEVAVALNSYAMLLDRKGDRDGAVTAYREFIRIAQVIHQGRAHPDLAAGYSNLAMTLQGQGRLDEAAAMFLLSIQVADQVLAADHPNRAFPKVGLASIYMEQGRFATAEPILREALALRRSALPAGHRYIGDSLIELGTCLTGLRRFGEAEEHLLEAYRLLLKGLGAQDDRTQRALRRLDALYRAWGRPERAAALRSGS
jgi:serine/threonine-protein kinase